jgi:glycosyltransferase involved in cell wall biosynthesis
VRRQIAEAGLEDRITLSGERSPEGLSEVYGSADIFVLPSRDEGYGMAFAEALAHGLPIVACAAGAVPETVPPDTGILVPVDAVGALRDALRRMITDVGLCRTMSDAAWEAGRNLPQWSDTARAVAQALDAAASRRG